MVVRFSGGHQVSHTVEVNGFRHTFSNFGAGTLRGIPTWYAAATTLFPPAIAHERRLIEAFTPQLFVHPLAMVVTPYDIAWNRVQERRIRHGSCGVGYGATVERNRAGIKLAAKDLINSFVVREKLVGIRGYYERLGDEVIRADWQREIEDIADAAFVDACAAARTFFRLLTACEMRDTYDHLIFEGNQGVPLDAEEGIFPHVSWSACTSEKALALLTSLGRHEAPDIFYVTRCYQTRHGAGPMSNATPVHLINADTEANVENAWQGAFRTAELDLDLLDWSLATDLAHQEAFRLATGQDPRQNLIITCLDQRPGFDIQSLIARFGARFASIWGSFSADSKDMRRLA